jgi:hypothetical protein
MNSPSETVSNQKPPALRYYEIAVWALIYCALSTVACTVASGVSFFFSPLISGVFLLLVKISLGIAALAVVACFAIVIFGVLRFSLRGLLFTTLTIGAMLALLQTKNDSLHAVALIGMLGLMIYWSIALFEAFARLDRMESIYIKSTPTNSLPDNPSKTSPTPADPN